MEVILVVFLFALFLLILGVVEKLRHQRNIDSIPIRINVNGIRGKSTVTRLITGMIMDADYKTVGKTTGTSARMIYGPGDEEPIIRKPEGPNIREQKDVVTKAANLDVHCLVSECMAVNPDYQIIFQEQMLQANIGLIVNVLEDHMDVMGPTMEEVAEAFTATIPHNGHVIVNESEFVPYYREVAEKRGTKLIVCDTSRVSEEYLKKFEYMVFPENAALALAVADILEIDEETALRGMLTANPDPGAMQILPISDLNNPSYFVNGFSANDSASTINIWKRVKELGYPTDKPVIIMNARDDRVDRTEQFVEDVLPHLDIDTLVVIGSGASPITQAYNKEKIKVANYLNLEGYNTPEIMGSLQPYLKGRTIYGIGNIHGAGEPLIKELEGIKLSNLKSQKEIS